MQCSTGRNPSSLSKAENRLHAQKALMVRLLGGGLAGAAMGQEAEVKVASAAKAVCRARIIYGLKPVPFCLSSPLRVFEGDGL